MKNKSFIAFVFVLFILLIGLLYQVVVNLQPVPKYAFLTIGIVVFVVMSFIFGRKKSIDMPIEKIYLIFAIIFGLIYLFVLPIGGVPDERNHFLRVYEISEGHMVSNTADDGTGGNILPSSASQIFGDVYNYKYYVMNDKIKLTQDSERTFLKFGNTSLYSPVSYLPQVIGVLIGRVLRLPMLIIAYLGRITNYIIYVIIMFMVIKYIPILKRVTFLMAFTPMMMQEAASLSPDALVNCCAFGLIAFILYSIYNKKKIMSKKEITIVSSLAIVLSLCKIVYLPLVFLVLLIPNTRFKTKKNKRVYNAILITLCLVLNLTWLFISSKYLVEFNPGVNSKDQAIYLMTHPFNYFIVIMRTLKNYMITLLFTFYGSHLEWLNVYISQPIILLYAIFAALITFEDNDNNKLNIKEKIVFLIIGLIIIALTFTSIYVQWTPFNNATIDGLQGRYFIPLTLIFALFIRNSNIKFKKLISNQYVYSMAIFISIYSVLTILVSHL